MVMKEKNFIVYRKLHPKDPPKYKHYKVLIKPGMTVLDALFYIQDNYDPTLAFRYSCRGAICGSCGMTINKFPCLACKTQVDSIEVKKHSKVPVLRFGGIKDWDLQNEILIEPLPNMPVIKDLIVDMEQFWKFYREVKPYFDIELQNQKVESKQIPDEVKRFEHLIYCILCGLCWTCPVTAKNKNYLGPSALAKAYRFVDDSRITEKQRKLILSRINQKDGIVACEKIFACNAVCPKNVKPGTAIDKLRKIGK